MKTMMRTIAIAVVGALALSGCIKMEFNIELKSDDTVDGEIIFAVQEGFGEMMGDMGEGILTDEEAAADFFGDDLDTSDFQNATVEEYKVDGWVGSRIVFTDEPLSEFDIDADDLRIYRDGDDFVVSGPFSGDSEDEDLSMFEGAELTMSVTFPGTVSSHNGTLDGTTVTWDLMNEPSDGLQARGSATGGGGGSLPILLIAIVAALLVLIAAVVATVVVLSKRNKGGAVPAADAPAPIASE